MSRSAHLTWRRLAQHLGHHRRASTTPRRVCAYLGAPGQDGHRRLPRAAGRRRRVAGAPDPGGARLRGGRAPAPGVRRRFPSRPPRVHRAGPGWSTGGRGRSRVCRGMVPRVATAVRRSRLEALALATERGGYSDCRAHRPPAFFLRFWREEKAGTIERTKPTSTWGAIPAARSKPAGRPTAER